MQFDQYSRLAICLKIFGFWPIIRKRTWNMKKSFPLVCRASRDESIDVKHQRLGIKQSPAIRLTIMVQTDRIDFGMYSQRPFEW